MGFRKRQLGGAKKYFKYSECTKGQVLVPQGRFVGTSPGYMGSTEKPNFNFKDVDTDEITSLNFAGQLAYTIENYISEGDVVEVIFDGVQEDFEAKPGQSKPNGFIVNALEEDVVGDEPTTTEEIVKAEKKVAKSNKKAAKSTGVSLSDLD